MQLDDTTDTTTLSYWLNWRVYLCVVPVFLSIILASLAIWKNESSRNFTFGKRENQQNRTLSGDEAWKPCLKDIHPVCLLAFRVIAFSFLLASLIAKIHINGGLIFYYYTQWTFTLVTIYFGCGSMLSVYGCYQYRKSTNTMSDANIARIDVEQGPYMPLLYQDTTNLSRMEHLADPHFDIQKNQIASVWSYIFRILFQINAGAVMLTDCVYWLIIFPFLTLRDYDLNFMTVNMHTLNLILLLGDVALNCLRISWSGMSFFVIWTAVYVIFQWTIHASVSIWWPYPFLDLSSPYAPLCAKDGMVSKVKSQMQFSLRQNWIQLSQVDALSLFHAHGSNKVLIFMQYGNVKLLQLSLILLPFNCFQKTEGKEDLSSWLRKKLFILWFCCAYSSIVGFIQ